MKTVETKKSVLWVLLAVLLIVSNIVVGKVFSLGNLDFMGSVFIYPFTFLIVVLIREFYSEKEALKAILMAVFSQLLVLFLLSMVSLLPVIEGAEGAHELIAGLIKDVPSILFSVVSFVVTQLIAIKLYPTFKNYFAKPISAFFTMLFSLALDSVIYVLLNNLAALNFDTIMPAIASAWFAYVITAVIMTVVYYYIVSFDDEEPTKAKK